MESILEKNTNDVKFSEPTRWFKCRVKLLSGTFLHILHLESKHRTSVSFCYLFILDIFKYVTYYSTCTIQNALYFILLELILMYTLVSEIHVFIQVILKGQLSWSPDGSAGKPLATNLKVAGSSSSPTARIVRDFTFSLSMGPCRSTETIQMKSTTDGQETLLYHYPTEDRQAIVRHAQNQQENAGTSNQQNKTGHVYVRMIIDTCVTTFSLYCVLCNIYRVRKSLVLVCRSKLNYKNYE